MDHLAIMRKSWGLLPKILNKEKTIESRWYKNKYSPWDRIEKGDFVYFKDSGQPVTVRAEVLSVLQFSGLNPQKVRDILGKYAKQDAIQRNEIGKYYQLFKDKNYCLLVFLKNPERIKPFEINKKGFGIMSAWITVDDINKIKKP
ncbi:hypothetical protein KKC00_01410 [Patescibacteria group bacterium]|nr:hypothetical protein [Patescibacteria group bacterium]